MIIIKQRENMKWVIKTINEIEALIVNLSKGAILNKEDVGLDNIRKALEIYKMDISEQHTNEKILTEDEIEYVKRMFMSNYSYCYEYIKEIEDYEKPIDFLKVFNMDCSKSSVSMCKLLVKTMVDNKSLKSEVQELVWSYVKKGNHYNEIKEVVKENGIYANNYKEW